jgi:hypothetical protein
MHVLFDLTFLASQFSYIQLLKSARGLVGASEHSFPGRSMLLITMIVEQMFQHIFTWANATRTAVPNSPTHSPLQNRTLPHSHPPPFSAAGVLRPTSISGSQRAPCRLHL